MSTVIPQLDWFVQHRVKSITAHDEDERAADVFIWSIDFEGGGRVRNADPNVPIPMADIIGTSFLRLSLSQSSTEMLFGHSTESGPPQIVSNVLLTPMHYAVETPQMGGTHWPQRDVH